MILEVLSPGVQNTEQPDVSSEVLRVADNFDHRSGAAAQEQVVRAGACSEEQVRRAHAAR
jgi:hypothetical protein